MSAATPTLTDLGPNSQNHHTGKMTRTSYLTQPTWWTHLHMNFWWTPAYTGTHRNAEVVQWLQVPTVACQLSRSKARQGHHTSGCPVLPSSHTLDRIKPGTVTPVVPKPSSFTLSEVLWLDGLSGCLRCIKIGREQSSPQSPNVVWSMVGGCLSAFKIGGRAQSPLLGRQRNQRFPPKPQRRSPFTQSLAIVKRSQRNSLGTMHLPMSLNPVALTRCEQHNAATTALQGPSPPNQFTNPKHTQYTKSVIKC